MQKTNASFCKPHFIFTFNSLGRLSVQLVIEFKSLAAVGFFYIHFDLLYLSDCFTCDAPSTGSQWQHCQSVSSYF